jgi:branched-chain amino acid transport system ATP-binding protein
MSRARPGSPAEAGAADRPLLTMRDVEVRYGGSAVAVQGVSLEVPAGEIVVLVGPNGAGKTTTLRAATGFMASEKAAITRGRVHFDGEDVTGQSPQHLARRGITLIPERDKVFRSLTVEENLKVVSSKRAANRDVLALVHELFPVLDRRRKQKAGYLSGGEVQMLAIGRALMLAPRLLLPDEISLGIAPAVVAELMAAIRRINSETGITVLMVEQNAVAGLSIADRAYVMEGGRVVFSGTPQSLGEREGLRAAYLGGARMLV